MVLEPPRSDAAGERSIERLESALRECETGHARTRAEFERFLHTLSHDLREPARMVSSYCGLLQRRHSGSLAPEANEFLEFAVDGARRMQAMLDALVELSRISIRPAERETINCDEVLDAALDRLSSKIARKSARIRRAPLPEALGDPAQIARLLEILIDNALEHHGEGPPQVEIAAARDGASWRISVADDGPGIAPEHRERIFAPFQRLRPRSARPATALADGRPSGAGQRGPETAAPALGVGLAFARAIAERHGGRIELRSPATGASRGSIFTFTLPAPEGGGR